MTGAIKDKIYQEIVDLYVSYLAEMGLSRTTLRNYKSDVNHFMRWLRTMNISVAGIDKETVMDYLETLQESKAPEKTVNRKSSSIRRFIRYLQRAGLIIESETVEGINYLQLQGVRKTEWERLSPWGLLFLFAVVLVSSISTANERVRNSENVLGSKPKIYEAGNELRIVLDQPEIAGEDMEINDRVEAELVNRAEIRQQEELELFGSRKGMTIIRAGQKEQIIKADVMPGSLVYVTPTSPIYEARIYIKSIAMGEFVVALEKPVEYDISVNWLVE